MTWFFYYWHCIHDQSHNKCNLLVSVLKVGNITNLGFEGDSSWSSHIWPLDCPVNKTAGQLAFLTGYCAFVNPILGIWRESVSTNRRPTSTNCYGLSGLLLNKTFSLPSFR